MTGTPQHISAGTLNVIPLPAHNDLSQQQVRGAACVWCAVTLAPGTAVDLGQRRVRVLDDHVTTFPRGCRQCTGKAAYRALFDHCPTCKQCVDNAAECATGSSLRRLVKEGFRR